MFNQLEAIAKLDHPRTPVLGCRISKALEPENVLDDVRMFTPLELSYKTFGLVLHRRPGGIYVNLLMC